MFKINDSGGATHAHLAELEVEAEELSPAALRIVGGVVGVPAERVVAAVRDLTPEAFGKLRENFRKMSV